jgi:hypothetical protein
MRLQDSDCEFRNRFWIIASIYAVTFACYRVDPTNITIALTSRILRWASHGAAVTIDDPNFNNTARLFLACGTILLVLSALIRSWATAYLRSDVVHDSAIHSHLLVADSPYRHVRNPLSQGESYHRYFEAVPRLCPSPLARIPVSGAQPNWRDGVLGEMFFWIFAPGMAAFTGTLQSNHFLIALGTGFALYFLQNYLRMGRIA